MSSKTILLVEDIPNNIGPTQRALEKAHILKEPAIAEDGHQDQLSGEENA